MLQEMLIVFFSSKLNIFFPSAIIEWKKLDPTIWNVESSQIY